MLFATDFGALPVKVASFLGFEPRIAHEAWNRILVNPHRRYSKCVNHIIGSRDDTDFLANRHHQWVVDFQQIVVYGFACLGAAVVGDNPVSIVQCRQKADAFTLPLDIVVTPFPLLTSGFDGEISAGRVFLRNHRLGRRQSHGDDDQERHHCPSNFNCR